MDSELDQISEELKLKNWDKELLNYKRSLIKTSPIIHRTYSVVEFDLIRRIGLLGLIFGGVLGYFLNLQGIIYLFITGSAFTSILCGLFFGFRGIILTPIVMGFLIVFGMSLMPFLLQSFFLFKVIGVLTGALAGSIFVGVTSNVVLHLSKKSDKQFDRTCRTEELTPRELLGFWDNVLKNSLHSHRYEVLNKRSKARESFNYWNERGDSKTASFNDNKIFQSKSNYYKNVVKQADQLLENIYQLEKDMSERINRLRETVKKYDNDLNQTLETNQLDNRVANLINRADSVSQQWLAERKIVKSNRDESLKSLLEYVDDVEVSISKIIEHDN